MELCFVEAEVYLKLLEGFKCGHTHYVSQDQYPNVVPSTHLTISNWAFSCTCLTSKHLGMELSQRTLTGYIE